MREVSSTAIRQRVALGQGIDDLVDADVAQYIHRNKLYKDDITLKEKTFLGQVNYVTIWSRHSKI